MDTMFLNTFRKIFLTLGFLACGFGMAWGMPEKSDGKDIEKEIERLTNEYQKNKNLIQKNVLLYNVLLYNEAKNFQEKFDLEGNPELALQSQQSAKEYLKENAQRSYSNLNLEGQIKKLKKEKKANDKKSFCDKLEEKKEDVEKKKEPVAQPKSNEISKDENLSEKKEKNTIENKNSPCKNYMKSIIEDNKQKLSKLYVARDQVNLLSHPKLFTYVLALWLVNTGLLTAQSYGKLTSLGTPEQISKIRYALHHGQLKVLMKMFREGKLKDKVLIVRIVLAYLVGAGLLVDGLYLNKRLTWVIYCYALLTKGYIRNLISQR
jgi:hypothetical protein